eukprot:Plantae.Rhodophyta-Rhodochaete_pulchella.ctg9189.p1 GENE.Plantae.Rhodophyta-Rhodochaete_pulchella.ctg9189~~Plantae.Rhodophyta-Rhodochaete_pulchella.ctg9189.p1  ORF type:complete len:262 (-),score=37.41 Plantae.Rhodophyta-Rhodochaete_pulchella.ctg9189:160-945(-)
MTLVRWRDPGLEGMRIVAYVGLALLSGLLLRFRFNKNNVHPFAASFFTVALLLLPANFLIFASRNEAEIVRDEIGNGLYSIVAFWLAQTIIDCVILSGVALVIAPTFFFLAGFNNAPGRFGVFLATVLLLINASDSAVRFIVDLVVDPHLAFAVSLVVYSLSILTSGFFVFRNQLSWVFRWMTWISLGFLSYTTIIINHLRGLDKLEIPPFDLDLPVLPGDAIIELIDLGDVTAGANLATMVALIVAFRFLTVGLLWARLR